MPEQSYASHRRYHPLYHFIVLPIVAINVLVRIYLLYREHSWLAAWDLVVAVAVAGVVWVVREYATKLQDRIIRVEERQRLERLLPAELHGRIADLDSRQLVALRFSHDDEVAALVSIALQERADAELIKKSIRSWRADHMRV